ncbi:hypothetical protein [Collinsella aerofaciens]|uniref:hypothetical protein n=1 Tax=Collinsella aerofaciens TaxID=74426 RepID=UPI003D7C10F8
MPTNDERRAMAASLRDLAAEDLEDGEFYDCGEVEDALDLVTDDGYWYEVDGVRRLADLIEPESEQTCTMDKSEFADFAPEYEGLYSCHKCGEQTAVLACVNEDGDMEWVKPRFCGFCGGRVVEK